MQRSAIVRCADFLLVYTLEIRGVRQTYKKRAHKHAQKLAQVLTLRPCCDYKFLPCLINMHAVHRLNGIYSSISVIDDNLWDMSKC